MQILEAPTDRLEQTTSYFCGAACSQMLLQRAAIHMSQSSIYKSIRANNAEPEAFYSDPVGISASLNNVDSDPFQDGDLVVVGSDSSESVASRIFSNIFDNKIPSICLINNGNHWVVCHKLAYDLKSGSDVVVAGVFILDPWPNSPPEVFFPLDQFIENVLNVNVFGTRWKGKRVFLIGERQNPRSFSVSLVSQSLGKGGGGAPQPDLAIMVENLRQVGLEHAQMPAGGGSAPLQVIDLFDGSSYYLYLIDARSSTIFSGMVFAAVSLESKILEVTLDRGEPFFAADVLAEEAIKTQLGESGYTIDHQLFWMRNGILRNRFQIARKATKNGKIVWILPNGQVVDSLSSGPRGGM